MSNYEQTQDLCHTLLSSAINFISNDKQECIAKLECYARTLCGLSYWLVAPHNNAKAHRENVINFLALGTNVVNNIWYIKDAYKSFNQILVEAAYIGLAFLRAPAILALLSNSELKIYCRLFYKASKIEALNNNWILFPAIVAAAYEHTCTLLAEEPEDDLADLVLDPLLSAPAAKNIIVYALRQIDTWYTGDGWYKDGEYFQFDYYNSYVIYPMVRALSRYMMEVYNVDYGLYVLGARATRFAEILLSLVSPEGTIPVLGRSSTYRFAALGHLSEYLLVYKDVNKKYLSNLKPDAVCNALTAVITNYNLSASINKNILQSGLVVPKQIQTEWYISAGSSYLCAMGLAHAALPKTHAAWKNPNAEWLQKRIWSGKKINLPKSIHL